MSVEFQRRLGDQPLGEEDPLGAAIWTGEAWHGRGISRRRCRAPSPARSARRSTPVVQRPRLAISFSARPVTALVPRIRRRARRAFGTAAQTRRKPMASAPRRWRRRQLRRAVGAPTDGTAIDAGRRHAAEEAPVEAGVAGLQRAVQRAGSRSMALFAAERRAPTRYFRTIEAGGPKRRRNEKRRTLPGARRCVRPRPKLTSRGTRSASSRSPGGSSSRWS